MPPRRARRGQALVEFALVLPILLSFLTGIVDVGFLYNHQLVLTNAAREGARLGSLGEDAPTVQNAVLAYLGNSAYSPLPAAADVTVSLANGQSSVAIRSTVPVLFAMSGPAIPLSASTSMRTE